MTTRLEAWLRLSCGRLMSGELSLSAKIAGYVVACAAFTLAVWVLIATPTNRSMAVDVPVPATRGPSRITAPPQPELLLVKPLTPEQAIAANEARAIAPGGLQTAYSFTASNRTAAPAGHEAAVNCLTAAIYYEARGEPEQGQRAVAQIVLNRVRHPAFPATVCGVVYQGSEFSSGCQFTFACDGSLERRPSPRGWEHARRIAQAALAGQVEPSVGMATHYHANWVVPYWAPNLEKIAAVGAHVFYRWRGYWGQRRAFSQPYAGESAEAPRLASAQDLLATWNDDSPRSVTSGQADAGADFLNSEPHLLVADGSTPRVAADDRSGQLVVDDHPINLASAKPSERGW